MKKENRRMKARDNEKRKTIKRGKEKKEEKERRRRRWKENAGNSLESGKVAQ